MWSIPLTNPSTNSPPHCAEAPPTASALPAGWPLAADPGPGGWRPVAAAAPGGPAPEIRDR